MFVVSEPIASLNTQTKMHQNIVPKHSLYTGKNFVQIQAVIFPNIIPLRLLTNPEHILCLCLRYASHVQIPPLSKSLIIPQKTPQGAQLSISTNPLILFYLLTRVVSILFVRSRSQLDLFLMLLLIFYNELKHFFRK